MDSSREHVAAEDVGPERMLPREGKVLVRSIGNGDIGEKDPDTREDRDDDVSDDHPEGNHGDLVALQASQSIPPE